MNTAGKLSAYGLTLALLAIGGWAGGAAVGPVSTAEPRQGSDGHADSHSGTVAEGHRHDVTTSHEPDGLASSRNGYTLAVSDTTLTAGRTHSLSFRILGPDGEPVRTFDVEHEKRLHLILVRRDAVGFRHLHPRLGEDGEWTVPVRLPAAGSYRMYADFTPTGGESLTLGTDLAVPGDFRPVTHEPSRVWQDGDYQVRLAGDIRAGSGSTLTARVTRNGRPVTDLEPYLGAYGHLVALRGSDLAYVHVHPEGELGNSEPGPEIPFAVQVPSDGDYRLFLDFRHDGQVRTADFTVRVAAADRANTSADSEGAEGSSEPPNEDGHGRVGGGDG